jgi:ABC-type glycerol-3-phosphate transport system substrate-binding protein
LKYMANLYKYAEPASLAWTHFEAYDSFAQGRTSQTITWDGGLAAFIMRKDKSKYYDVMKASGVPGTLVNGKMTYGPPLHVWYMSVNKESPNKEAAWDLIRNVTYERAVDYTKIASYICTYKAAKDVEKRGDNPVYNATMATLDRARAEGGGADYMQMTDIVGTEVSYVLSGQKTAENAIKSAQDKLKALYKK